MLKPLTPRNDSFLLTWEIRQGLRIYSDYFLILYFNIFSYRKTLATKNKEKCLKDMLDMTQLVLKQLRQNYKDSIK